MIILYTFLGLFMFWIVVWILRISKAIVITMNYWNLVKFFLYIILIWSIIHILDYLITR